MTTDAPRLTTAELFAAGNYTTVAMTGSPEQWETYAAMGLIGKTQAAIDGLSRFDHPEARFYSAVASWMDGDEATAVRILEKIATPHAQNLLTLIRKPQIHVLAQLPWTREAPHDLLTTAARDGKFKIQNISFHPQDLPNEPDADIRTFYNSQNPPDFYICQMVEWHVIPPNLQQLPCPILGATADYDVHTQTVYPWLWAFDELMIAGQTEWQDVRRLAPVPVSTFPKLFGVADTLPPIPSGPREIDVFLSGTVMHPYHPDKARLLHQLLRMPDHIKILFINGFIVPDDYNMILGHSKVSFTYVRHPDGTVTRGLEALSMGCAVVVQKGSVLTLYVGEGEGVLTYQSEADNLVPAICQIVDNWPEFEQRARQGAEIIRREFALSRVASQYLRFLTFLAAKPRGQRQIQPAEQLNQKRSVLRTGWLPGGPEVLQKMRERNLARWQARLETEASPRLVIDMARELVLEYAPAARENNSLSPNKQLLTQAFSLYQTSLARFPQSLVLRFNLIRTALHFGQPKDVKEALQLAEKTLGMPQSSFKIDVMEDVFPYDFFSTFFNYRKYFDLVTEHLIEGTQVSPALTQLILASLHYYLSHYSDNFEHPKQAVALDPDFSFYKLRYAQELVKRGRSGDYAEAGSLLTKLAENSILFVEAFKLLKQLQEQNLFVSPQFAELTRVVTRLYHNAKFIKNLGVSIFNADWRFATLQPAATLPASASAAQPIAPAARGGQLQPGIDSHQGTSMVSTKKYLVSALVPTYNAERFMRGLLEDLEAQTIADQLEIVIVDSNSPQNERAIVEEFQQRYDNIVYVRTDEWENSHAGINRCIRLARGKYLALACTDDRHKPDAYERMVAVLETRPDIALVYANSYITATENETFFNHTSVGAYRWHDFDPLKLLHGCFMGPQPMWCKSIHEKYGYFDESLEQAGDWDFWLRMAEAETFLHIDEFLGLYLYSPTSREHREPELSRREAQLVQQRYLHRETELRERQRRALLNLPATSGTLALVVRGTAPNEQVAHCEEQLRLYSPSSGDLSVKVVRAHPDIPENDLDVKVSPKTPTVLEAFRQGIAWEARYLVLLSPDVLVTRGWLDKLLAVADSDPFIAAVGPTSNAAPAPQKIEVVHEAEGCERSEQDYGNLENELQEFADRRAAQYGYEYEQVPYLGGFCLLLKSNAVRQVEGLQEMLSLPSALWDIYARLQTGGFKLACARGAYVHHAELTEDEGASYDDLAAAEQYAREAMAAGQLALERGDFDTAVVEFERLIRDLPDKAVSLKSNYSSLYDELGKCFYKIGQIENAKNAFQKALELNPQDSQAYSNLGVLYWETGNADAAIENLKQAVEINPDDADAVANLAIICYQVGLFGEAILLFKKFLMQQPQDAQIHFYLGDCYFQTGENLGAKEELQIVLAAEPEHQLAQNLFAKLKNLEAIK